MRDKIKYTSLPLPETMWGIKYKIGNKLHLEITDYSDNFREGYLLLFNTESEANAHIANMNTKYNKLFNGERGYWYKNRHSFPAKVNTTLKKYKSKYRPITSLTMGNILG